MTTQPKKQLFNFRFLPVSAFLFFLAGFFLYALFVERRFFSVLAALIFLTAAGLVPFWRKKNLAESDAKIRREAYAEKLNLLENEVVKETAALQSIRHKIVNYQQLKGLTENLSLCLTRADTAEVLTREVNKIFADSGVTVILYFFEQASGELAAVSACRDQKKTQVKLKKGDTFDHCVFKSLRPLFIEDTRSDFRFDMEKVPVKEDRPVRSVMSVPLMMNNRLLGVLRLDSPKENHFTTVDLRFLNAVGGLAAVALENAHLYERVEELAIRDGLTGTYLRRYLLERMDTEISRELRGRRALSFLMIDLDFFKKYNDQFGHMAGDIVLKTVGRILSRTFQEPGSIVCRYGGEEFSVLLPDCSKDKAVLFAEDFRKAVEKKTVSLRRRRTNITVSIGVASLPEDTQVKDELIDIADKRLYQAKTSGRNRVCFDSG